MNKIFTLAFVIFASTMLTAQNKYELISSFPIEGNALAADEFKNSYIVNSENNVLKLDSVGKLISIYSENQYGNVTTLDATNPFTIVAYYRDFNTAITLDANMNAKRLFKFSAAGLSDVAATCMSYDGNLWTFDLNDQKLKKVNQDYEVVHESAPITQMFEEGLSPNFMIERNQMIFVNDPSQGIFVFDVYGVYYKVIQIPNLENFQIIQGQLVCYSGNKLYAFELSSQREKEIKLPAVEEKILDLRVTRNYLILLTASELQLYKVSAG